jgi:hypothetical protein
VNVTVRIDAHNNNNEDKYQYHFWVTILELGFIPGFSMNPKHLYAERIPKLEKEHNFPSCDKKLHKPNYISQLKNAPADWKCNKQCHEDHLSVLFREVKF